MATQAGDIQINGKDYLLRYGGYDVFESFKSAPRLGGVSAPEFERADNWNYWGQSDWVGEGIDEWQPSDGLYLEGYGLDLTTAGQIKIAKRLAAAQADTANTGGYVAFADGTTRVWFMGKTNDKAYHSVDGTTWIEKDDALAAGVNPTSAVLYKGSWRVGGSNGSLYTLSGTTFTSTAGAVGTAVYLLGSYKGKLWAGYANKLYTWDGTTWSEQFATAIDGTPIIGALGNAYLYFVTQGPFSKIYLTDGGQLHQVGSIASDFMPQAVTYIENLMIWGNATDDSNVKGQVWRLDGSGLTPIFEFGTGSADGGFRSAIVDNGRAYWGANQITGLGVYDPAIDIFEDYQSGFYVGSSITSVAGVVHGIAQFAGVYYVGIQGSGIYKQTTPGTFEIVSSLFFNKSKNINKLWGFAEVNHSAFLTGQTLTFKTMKDGATEDAWTVDGETDDVGDTATRWTSPSSQNYKSPQIQYVLSGDANAAALTIYDVSLAFLEVSDNPKREWDLVIVLEGGPDSPIGYQEMRNGDRNTRSATDMVTELNNLWNTKTTFEDIDGTTYNVIFKAPRARMDDIIKDQSLGTVTDLVVFYRVRLVQL